MLAVVFVAVLSQSPVNPPPQPLILEPVPVLDVPLDKRVVALLNDGASKKGWAGGFRALGIAAMLGGLAVQTYQSIAPEDAHVPRAPLLGLSIFAGGVISFIVGHVISNAAERDFAAAAGQGDPTATPARDAPAPLAPYVP